MTKERTPEVTRTSDTVDDARPRLFAFWPGGAASADLPPPGVELVIGRDPSSTLCIPHASVSRAHARLRGGEPPTIRDLGSHNGTRIGTRRLVDGEEAPLPANHVAKLGAASLIVQGGAARRDDDDDETL